MGLARKGSRSLHVKGRDYRWVVSPDDGYMVIVVEAASGEGQRMHAEIEYRDVTREDGRIVGQKANVSPGVVRRAIVHALAEGWQPEQGGLTPFRLDDADQKIWEAP